MNKKFYLPATVALCGAWLWALVSARVADDPRVGVPVLLVLGVASLAAVRHVQLRRVALGATVQVACAITLALMMFTLWGQVLTGLPTITLPESLPRYLRLSPLFLTGPMVAVITALLFAYPLVVLLPRFHWLVPLLAAVLVGLLQYDFIMDPTERPLTRTLMALEVASLAILVPVLVGIVGRRIRGRAEGALEAV